MRAGLKCDVPHDLVGTEKPTLVSKPGPIPGGLESSYGMQDAELWVVSCFPWFNVGRLARSRAGAAS